MSEQHLDAELKSLADALARLKPSHAALNRDALMFRAGQASAPRGWRWPLATAAATLLALALGLALLLRPQPSLVERTVYVKVPAAEVPEPKPSLTPSVAQSVPVAVERDPSSMSDQRRLQEHLLRWGLDGLPPAPHLPPTRKETPESLLRSL